MSRDSAPAARPPAAAAPDALLPWALARLGRSATTESLEPVAGDASNRRYFRLGQPGRGHILVSAPPETEKNAAFLAARELLAAAGVRVPEILAAELEQGFLLLQDLGDELLIDHLGDARAGDWYGCCFSILERLASIDMGGRGWPAYDRALLTEELGRFPTWFAGALLDRPLGAEVQQRFEQFAARLIESALEQPQVLVHRDFHSRNLMPQPDGELAVIDFQDAVLGPATYDLVSLLRDCYIRWPEERVRAWALAYRHSAAGRALFGELADDRFLRWFDWMGLQRHIKVLGTFARLYLRDGKDRYLADLPRVLVHMRTVLARYAGDEQEFTWFSDWFEAELAPVIATREWSRQP